MKPFVDIIIVIPVGPTCKIEFILDTITSVTFYIRSKKKIIIADDSQNPLIAKKIKEFLPDVIILPNRRNYGKGTGLYTSLSNAYAYALDHFDFPALLRLDTDALIIGYDPDLQINEFFRNNPTVGLAGRYVKGLRSPDDFDNVWDNYGGRGLIIAIAKMFNRYFLRHPFAFWKIRVQLFKAVVQGYEFGDLIFGGSYTFSRVGLEKLRENGLLPIKNILGVGLEEDHFFTLLVGSVGLGFGDLASGSGPFACTWKGLPAHPETLHNAGKKIIHSTRFWKDLNEEQIRNFFREKRSVSQDETVTNGMQHMEEPTSG